MDLDLFPLVVLRVDPLAVLDGEVSGSGDAAQAVERGEHRAGEEGAGQTVAATTGATARGE